MNRPAIRMALLAIVYLLGTLFALGSVLAMRFELEGFASGRDGPRTWYVTAQILGFIVCVAIPIVATRILMPHRTRQAILAYAPALLLAGALLGLS